MSQLRGSVSRWYVYGLQDETRYLIDSFHNFTDSQAFAAFGESLSSVGATVNPFRYKGRYGYYGYDEPFTLLYVRVRYLKTLTGRWISRDPLGFDGGDTKHITHRESNRR